MQQLAVFLLLCFKLPQLRDVLIQSAAPHAQALGAEGKHRSLIDLRRRSASYKLPNPLFWDQDKNFLLLELKPIELRVSEDELNVLSDAFEFIGTLVNVLVLITLLISGI